MSLRMLRDVLVVTDGSAASVDAIARTLSLRIDHDATLHLLCTGSSKGPPPSLAVVERSVVNRARAEGRSDLKVVAYRARTPLWQEIALHARSLVVDLVVTGGLGRDVSDATGTPLPRLAAVAGAPVLVATPRSAQPYERLLVAIDMEIGSIDLVRLAARLTGRTSTAITVLHAFEVSIEGTSFRGGLSAWGEKFLAEARCRVEEFLETVRPTAGSLDVVVVPGPAGPAIVETAAQRGIDLVVVGSHAVEGLPFLLTGSVSRHLAARLECDLLVARPLSERIAFPPQTGIRRGPW
jgi:nucleotide-binding universal stress UspA family protein